MLYRFDLNSLEWPDFIQKSLKNYEGQFNLKDVFAENKSLERFFLSSLQLHEDPQ